jgi:adenosylcobinamide-GDP ribazoletransferase
MAHTPRPQLAPEPEHDGAGGVRYQLRLFFTAVQFFTRLPIPRWVGFAPAWLRHASRYFPAVGMVVALACAIVYWLLAWCLPQMIAVLLSTAVGIYLTGALHEDGFADVCDGFGGGMQASQVMEIMRDSRIGAYGMVGMTLLLALKVASLSYLPAMQVVPALLLAHPLSRGLACSLIWRMDYVRQEGKAKSLAQQMNTLEFAIAMLTALVPLCACLLLGCFSLATLLLTCSLGLVATFFLARMFRRRIGGYTGDCLGAVQQLSEVAIYLGLLAAASSSLSL